MRSRKSEKWQEYVKPFCVDAFYSIIRRDNKIGIAVRDDLCEKLVEVCECKYDMIYQLNIRTSIYENSYAYFAVMNKGRYGIIKLEALDSWSGKYYAIKLVPCAFNAFHISKFEINDERWIIMLENQKTAEDCIEWSYYNPDTGKISDIYTGMRLFGECFLICHDVKCNRFVIDLRTDEVIYEAKKELLTFVTNFKEWHVWYSENLNNEKQLVIYNDRKKNIYKTKAKYTIDVYRKNHCIETIALTNDEANYTITLDEEGLSSLITKEY